MVREPIQSCESWMREQFNDNDWTSYVYKITSMLFEIDNIVYNKQSSIAIRLEDLKEYPHKTIPALCNWMGVEENESLYQMTAQGKKWWGDPSSPDYSKDGMEAFGRTSINRKVGSIFSKNDQFVLSTLFYPFSVRFGYVEENEKKFKANYIHFHKNDTLWGRLLQNGQVKNKVIFSSVNPNKSNYKIFDINDIL